MAINSIADIVARSPVRKVFSFNANGSTESLESILRYYLLKSGWSQSDDTTFTSRIVETRTDSNGAPYQQAVRISWTVFLDTELHILVSDKYDTFTANQFIRLKPSNNLCYFLGGSHQFAIISSSTFDSDYSSILVSCLNIPPFQPFLNCICAFEVGSFLRNYATQDFNYYLGACVRPDRSVLLNNPIGGSGGAGIITLPVYTSKVIVNWSGEFGVKSPCWVSWGDTLPSDVPFLRGFLWDFFLWYDNRFNAFTGITIDQRSCLQLVRNSNNILSFEYGAKQ